MFFFILAAVWNPNGEEQNVLLIRGRLELRPDWWIFCSTCWQQSSELLSSATTARMSTFICGNRWRWTTSQRKCWCWPLVAATRQSGSWHLTCFSSYAHIMHGWTDGQTEKGYPPFRSAMGNQKPQFCVAWSPILNTEGNTLHTQLTLLFSLRVQPFISKRDSAGWDEGMCSVHYDMLRRRGRNQTLLQEKRLNGARPVSITQCNSVHPLLSPWWCRARSLSVMYEKINSVTDLLESLQVFGAIQVSVWVLGRNRQGQAVWWKSRPQTKCSPSGHYSENTFIVFKRTIKKINK